MSNKNFVILVHGLLGCGPKELGPLRYWSSAFLVPSPLPRYEARVGLLGSAHDRACELAAQIKGAKVDYGADHAKKEGHRRYGIDYTGAGFVPDWNDSRPVHLVSHGFSSQIIRCLQHLLEIDYWGWNSNHRWVASVNTISGILNGTPLAYYFGSNEKTGLLKRKSAATAIFRILKVFFQSTGVISDSVYNFDLEHWKFHRESGESLEDYIAKIANSKLLLGKDNAIYSLTLQGAYEDNALWKTYPDTYYFSYYAGFTDQSQFSGRHYPNSKMNPAMLAISAWIGQKTFNGFPISIVNFESSD